MSKLKNLPTQDCQTLISKLENRSLEDVDYGQVIQWLTLAEELILRLQEKDVTIRRLRKWLTGDRTEKRKTNSQDKTKGEPKKPSKKRKGHGRLAASDYKNAESQKVDCTESKAGDRCCDECDGVMKEVPSPSVRIQITGNPPLQAKRLEYQRLRCNKCLRTVTARPPDFEKYDAKAKSTLALLKYETAMPFYRLEQFQKKLGIPVPDATQWTLMERLADDVYPVYQAMIKMAARAELFHIDDTGVKILSLIKENKTNPGQERQGQHTTGLIAKVQDHLIYLFFHGRKHAGENIDDVLINRPNELKPPIQMSDALACNTSHDFMVIIVRCLTHARRYFIEIEDLWPDECQHVVRAIGQVYKYDRDTKSMTPEQRLDYHKQMSKPVMDDLKTWLEKQFDDRLAEPNSSLGKAYKYLLNHWNGLTEFYRRPGVPLDNNAVERALKTAVLQRKNAMFFKTEFGALVGSILTSIIKTCAESGENPLDYLVALQEHKQRVRENPENWMPWNYLKTLDHVMKSAA